MHADVNGFLPVDKPAGPTSFACVAALRRRLGIRRVGHTGTLDPRAEGVMILVLGTATRSQERFLDLPKRYWLQAELGRRTDTGDLAGQVVEDKPVPPLSDEQLRDQLHAMEGDHVQIPPAYAALKYKGKPYYRYARQGIVIPRVPRTVKLYRFDLLSFESPRWEARVECSRGTYVRTLVEDVAQALGTVGVLTRLIREAVGPFVRARALSLDAISTLDLDALRERILPVDQLDAELLHA